ncbi:GTPase-associated protein 1-related protein [Actinoplanes sp. NPDC051411]|uniref:GTPase-associated protein 1-related protein n=1 Tax=Actinoplanes sp. NPDC051411 TaxID=3155522 RepID=UPI003440D18D
MAFWQLYYTSCRDGLAGAPGFQFNAATPGLGEDVMRDVEQLTAYQPPRSAAPGDSPVNLCFRPGPVTVVARVEYVGVDYSHRPGNYFAHALVTRSPEADLGARPAIELWNAPFWRAEPVPGTELPPLAGPPPAGPLDRATAEAFTRGRPAARHLPAMLTAAEVAVRSGDRRVVLIGASDQELAYWIAALCYRLPAATVAALSFATYERDPRYSRAHLVGTLPTGDLGPSDQDFETFDLFDLTGDRVSDIAVHPLARMLAELSAADAAEAWRRAARLASGAEQSFDDWRPVVAATLMTWSGSESARDEQAAVSAWLAAGTAHLADTEVAELGRVTLACVPRDDAGDETVFTLGNLAAVAAARGLTALLDQVERRVIQAVVPRSHAMGALPSVPIRGEAGRAYGCELLSGELPRLPAAGAAALLAWAAGAGVPVSDGSLRELGRRTAGPALLLQPADPMLRAVLPGRPALCDGVVAYLGAVGAPEFDRLVEAVEAGLDEALGPAVTEAGPAVRQAVAVARVRAGRADPLDGLSAALDEGGDIPVGRLIDLLFPAGRWTVAEAGRAFAVLGPRRATIEPVTARFAATVLAEPPPGARAEHADLCLRLARSPVRARLSPAARDRVEMFANADRWADEIARSGKDRADLLKSLHSWLSRLPDADRRAVEEVLLRRFADFKASARADLIQGLIGLRRAYCAGLVAALRVREPDLAVGASAVRTLRHLAMKPASGANQAACSELDGALRASIGRWRSGRQNRFLEYVESSAPDTAAFLRRWYGQAPAGLLNRLARRLLPRGAPSPGPDPTQPRRSL